MTITVPLGGLTRCPGGNHFFLEFSVNAGPVRTLAFTKDEMIQDLDDPEMKCGVVVSRLRAIWQEAGSPTWAQIKAGVEGKTFKV